MGRRDSKQRCLLTPWKSTARSYETKVAPMNRSQGGGIAGQRGQDRAVQDRDRTWKGRGRTGRAGAQEGEGRAGQRRDRQDKGWTGQGRIGAGQRRRRAGAGQGQGRGMSEAG